MLDRTAKSGKPASPQITFGMIVLNGEPFVRYNLRALYPFAHQIIVVEGACPSATGVATPDGHSRDSTLATLRQFQAEEDHGGKVTVVTAEDEGHPNGFWTEKDEMSQTYAKRATGNYLWQIDSDEFYQPADMLAIIEKLTRDPSITAVTFRTITFWGGLDHTTDSFVFRRGECDFHRLFAWQPGFRYTGHRPPTVVDTQGRDLRTLHWMRAEMLARQGIFMYHYALLFPKQVIEKCAYYAKLSAGEFGDAERWAKDSYYHLQQPFHVHHINRALSWLQHYHGAHPPQVLAMVDAVTLGKHPGVILRGNADANALLSRLSYRIPRAVLIALIPLDLALQFLHDILRNLLYKTFVWTMLRRLKLLLTKTRTAQ